MLNEAGRRKGMGIKAERLKAKALAKRKSQVRKV
jgi:hypothetical protein